METLTNDPHPLSNDSLLASDCLTTGAEGESDRNAMKRQEALVAMGRRAIAPPDTAILIQDAAALLAEMFGAEASGAATVIGKGLRMEFRLTFANVDDEDDVVTETHVFDRAGEDSLADHVLQVAHPVAIENLDEQATLSDRFLRRHKFRSALAVPLKVQDRSFGSLAAYSWQHKHFRQEDILFAETVAHLVSATIARNEAEKALEHERRLAAGVLETVDAIVVLLNPQWQIHRINAACERITGFVIDEIGDRCIWNVFPVPEEIGVFRRLSEQLEKHGYADGYECYLLTKHGKRRRIAWSYRAINGGDDSLRQIVATGVDITQQRDAEQRAEKAEQVALKIQGSLSSLIEEKKASASEESLPNAFSPMPKPLNADRRQRPRRSYPYRQRVAPVIGDVQPAIDDFREVKCNDISAGGFSYLDSVPPTSETLVVALGVPPKVTYMTAQVAYVTRVDRDGERLFQVGCNYVHRADL